MKNTPMWQLHKYLRANKKFPHVWCSGCGNGIVLNTMLRAIDELGLEKDEVTVVSGIGCSSRLPVYIDFNTLHTTHGRAIAFATGVKVANPRMKVIVVTGDGDATAIGGNHFIHAARRNIDITTLVFNNFIYGMTGGQCSPTTPPGDRASTAPYGNIEREFDISNLAIAAGAAFVARTTAYHVHQARSIIKQAIAKKGFSVVEIITQCYTVYGRYNKFKSPVDMMKWQRDNAVPVAVAAKLPPEQMKGKFTTGVLIDRDLPEWCEEYDRIIKSCRGNKTNG